jgi:hypothetical protein
MSLAATNPVENQQKTLFSRGRFGPSPRFSCKKTPSTLDGGKNLPLHVRANATPKTSASWGIAEVGWLLPASACGAMDDFFHAHPDSSPPGLFSAAKAWRCW